MKKLFLLLSLLIAFSTNAQIGNPTTFSNGIILPNLSQGAATDSILSFNENGLVKYVAKSQLITDNQPASVVFVKEAADIANQELDSSKEYVFDGQITFGAGEFIIVPAGGLTISGYGFDITNLFSSAANHTLFTSPVGGSGNLVLKDLSITTVGAGSQVFDIVDSDGSHAIEIEYVNFSGCTSLGKQSGYRQGTWTTVGVYGVSDGLELDGNMSGFKVSNTNVFGFGATGTLFKRGASLLFSNRFFLNINIDFPTGAIVSDVQPSSFTSNELFQVNSSIAKVNGGFNLANAEALFPDITANDLQSLWVGNIGLPNTALEKLVDTDVNTTFDIDWFYNTYYLSASGPTVFTESNLPANTKNTQEIKIYLDPNGHNITFPAGWVTNLVGNLKSNELNEITLKYIKNGVYFMNINNSFSRYPAPFFYSINPPALLPNITDVVTITGDFFTPATTVSIESLNVLNVQFIDSQTLDVTVQSGATESSFDVIINNGTELIVPDAFMVNNGVVYAPTNADYINVSGEVDLVNGNVITSSPTVGGTATWDRVLPASGNWTYEFIFEKSPFFDPGGDIATFYYLVDATTNANIYSMEIKRSQQRHAMKLASNNTYLSPVGGLVGGGSTSTKISFKIAIRKTGNTIEAFCDGQLRWTITHEITNDLKLKFPTGLLDYKNIRYIDQTGI